MLFLKVKKKNYTSNKINNSKRNGWRKTIFSPNNLYCKEQYQGQWKDDKKEGIGIQINRHNILYKGEWLHGMKHGFGELSKIVENNNPKKMYAGYWFKGKKQGLGIHWYDSSFYNGCFLAGKKHGFGKMWWFDGKYYEGEWKNDMFHGNGILIFANGNEYKGQFINGDRQGNGVFYHKNTGQLQCGTWNNNVCIFSTIEDSSLKQVAKFPTSYSIPCLKNNANN